MPSLGQDRAQFDSVSETGDLIFTHNGSTFAVSVDDVLEHAILEARQIKAESLSDREPQPSSALPISQIQSAIRLGTDPARVAQRFEISPALVRRFSAPVETEKQYAIEQFLAVSTPKANRSGNIASVITDSLAHMGIDMKSVSWMATRRGLEPWRIVAQFDVASRQIRAQWSWNMHDNTIESLNPAARRLLGESEQTGASNANLEAGRTLGNRVSADNSQQIRGIADAKGRTNALGTRSLADHGGATGAPMHPDAADTTRLSASQASSGLPSSLGDTGRTGSAPVGTPSTPQRQSRRAQRQAVPLWNDEGSDVTGGSDRQGHGQGVPQRDGESDASGVVGANPNNTNASGEGFETERYSTGNNAYVEPVEQPESGGSDQSDQSSTPENRTPRRKNGRSAVPSWDEILFGE